MHSSLAYHCLLDLPSAAVLLGTTEGELYHYHKNNPPQRLNLQEIELIQKQKLKNGSYDSLWFESPAAMKDPLLFDSLEVLTSKLVNSLLTGDNTELVECFKCNMPKNKNLGGALECLRILNGKYPELTGQLSILADKLSDKEFFRLA